MKLGKEIMPNKKPLRPRSGITIYGISKLDKAILDCQEALKAGKELEIITTGMVENFMKVGR